ncbi:MAG: molybdopterin-dependent oxidoreductase [Acidobacteria bacterium]|nr:molybdopterin-dependent oxidoreductase [Acidobacteriota bacterium]
MKLTRRTLIKLGVTGGATVALAQALKQVPGAIPAVDGLMEQPFDRDLSDEWMPSVCAACPAACPVALRRVSNHIVGVRPFPSKPCQKAYIVPQELVHPDRVRESLRRDGQRGADHWRPVSRTAALEELSRIAGDDPSKTALVLREEIGLSFSLLTGLFGALGSPYLYTHEWIPGQWMVDAMEQATGWSAWGLDLARARGVISFGWDWLQSFDPRQAQEAFARLRVTDAPIWYVGPRWNLTAMKATKWLVCRPGFEPAVALALLHVIVSENLYPKECESLEGFSKLIEQVRVLSPADLEKKTGINHAQLQPLARRIATLRPLCVAPRRRLEDQAVIVALNGLLGNIGTPGGLAALGRSSLPPAPPAAPRLNVEELPKQIAEGRVETVILAGANPVFTSPAPSRWKEGLKQAKQVVCLSSFKNETTAFADLILPLPLWAERRDVYPYARDGRMITHVVEPALEPAPAMFDVSSLVFELAHGMGVEKERFPWQNLEEAAKALELRAPTEAKFNFPDIGWSEPPFSEGAFHLLLEAPLALRHGEGAHLPYLLTTVGPHLRTWWTTWVEINPETAHRLGVKDREEIILENASGSIRAIARYFPGVPADAVCLPLGMGHATGTFAQNAGGNPAEIVAYRKNDGANVMLWDFEKVNIRRGSL